MKTILAFYPNVKGIGFACVDMPQNLIDAGIISLKPFSHSKTVERLKKYIEFFRPKIVILRDESSVSKSSTRIQALICSVRDFTKEQQIPHFEYSREQIKQTFEQFEATRKYDIARKIIEWFPELADRTPKIRAKWMDEDYNMAIFDAISLAVTHEYLGE